MRVESLERSGSKSFTVTAVDLAGNSGFVTNTYSVTLPVPTPPNAPSNLTATAVSKVQINLNWADNANNESGFAIERCTPKGRICSFAQVAQVVADVKAFSNTGLSKGTEYHYRLRAFNATGNSAYSNIVIAKTLAK